MTGQFTRILTRIFLSLAALQPAMAQDIMPERRAIVTPDRDLAGTDLTQIFDTRFDACRNACIADTSCVAFTFNTRNNSCFPKSAVTRQDTYLGARSAVIRIASEADIARAATRAADLTMLGEATLRNAYDLAATIGEMHQAGGYTADTLVETSRQREADNDLLSAMRWMGGAVAQSDQADLWLDYSRLLVQALPRADSFRTTYLKRSLTAAVNGYLRAPGDPARTAALIQIAETLRLNNRGRDMIPVLRLAETIRPRDDIAAMLDDAIGKYGFRIADHTVESNLSDPRICAQFTEPLAKTGVTYADYVRLPDTSLAVEASGQQLCISGLDHGTRYNFTFREGLPAASGEVLAKDVDLSAYVRDRDPRVVFPGRAFVLPAAGEAAVPVTTVNLDTLALRLMRVTDRNILRSFQDGYFGRRLSDWELDSFVGDVGEIVWDGTAEVAQDLNEDVTTRLPLGEALAGQAPGLYVLEAAMERSADDQPAFQWFIVTDLGITTYLGHDGLHVFLRALGDAQPVPGVEVSLLGQANRVLSTATSDADGHVLFPEGLTRGTGGASPALVTATLGDDLAFLSLKDPAFDLSDRGVSGRPAGPAIDVFLATDRGAYRAGEDINLTILARDRTQKAISGLPLTAILTRPDSVEYARMALTGDRAGGYVLTMPLGPTAPRGTWTIDIKADLDEPALASAKVLVEDFLPERIDVTLDLPQGPLFADDLPELDLQSDFLFGAPASGLTVEGDLRLVSARQIETFPGYSFGRHDAQTYARNRTFSATTDDTGHVSIALPAAFPDEDLGAPFALTAIARVLEGSGRPVERSITRLVGPAGPAIGIRPLFDGTVQEGATARFNLIAIGPDLQPQPMQVRWSLNRVETRYQWYQQYGNWNWEPYTTRTRISAGTAILDPDGPVPVEVPTEWGHYELVVDRSDGAYVSTSVSFDAGWYAPADASATPDLLELSLDQPGYAVGDTARLRLAPRYPGTALVTVMSDHLIGNWTVPVGAEETTIDLPVTEDWGAGAYVAASVIRPMDTSAGQMPARSLGIQYAPVEPGDKALSVTIDAPDQAEPRKPLTAKIRLDAAPEGETVYATLAAVDVGILNLTGFEAPAPGDHYFGQRRLGMDIRDLYGRLIDSTQGAMGRVRSGGDALGQIRQDGPPPVEDLVALFSGPVEIGADGTADIAFDLPEFNGTVRLMAVVWSDTAVGAAQADVLIRDPVVVTATLPRFLQPGDRSAITLEMVHASGPVGRAGLDISATGVELGGPVPSGFDLEQGIRHRLSIPVTASEPGDHRISVVLTTPGGKVLTKTLVLPVRRNDPETTRTQRITLDPGDTLTLDDNAFAGFQGGGGDILISAGALARFDAPALLQSLDRYPYGCTEQVTSRALPLLYLSSLAESVGLAGPAGAGARVTQSIDRILARQTSTGAFGLWRAVGGDFWLDAYVTDFLSRAGKQGYDVPETAFRMALDNLRNRVNYAPDFDAGTENGGEDIAYALLVLAREGAASMGDLRYFADTKGNDFATPLAAAQLAAALAMYGDQTRADAMFRIAARKLSADTGDEEKPLLRADYGTRLRDTAGLLTLAVEAGSDAVDRADLINRVSGQGGAMSTQESTWTLLAARALVDEPALAGLTLDGAPLAGPVMRVDRSGALAPMALFNGGTAGTEITLTTSGVPEVPPEAGGYGYAIDRAYFSLEGAPVDPATVARGTRMVTVLTVRPFETVGARLMVDDPLPAGFEIDNPNLIRAGDLKDLAWLRPAEAQHSEFRADRFVAAVDWQGSDAFQLAYIVRAISPGTYRHSAATVEDMYRPRYRAWTGTGQVTVGP
ncbi:alpha-2-macroglobulin family protein [Pseudooceanicola sp. C21-150M6]|uniref:alpha-2-macroglobulin family protein n=1 Tax=Pseudooceanicola sp. C21-150M6 TaxID=3434355 RepID=UPI003D7F6644